MHFLPLFSFFEKKSKLFLVFLPFNALFVYFNFKRRNVNVSVCFVLTCTSATDSNVPPGYIVSSDKYHKRSVLSYSRPSLLKSSLVIRCTRKIMKPVLVYSSHIFILEKKPLPCVLYCYYHGAMFWRRLL